MDLLERLKEQLFYYHNATSIPLELCDENGNTIQSFSSDFRYCTMVREACGDRSFCDRMHNEGADQSDEIEDGYIFYQSANQVWLTASVPVRYLKKQQ